jgi:crotonobetainyl-CoA:carnitine CoA-transferase CaiB-like acyl-CoA transferase
MEEVFKDLDREPLCDRLLQAGLPAGPIQSIDKALNSAHSKHRGVVVQKDWYKGVASPIRFDRSKASLRHAPPAFSEHAAEILTEAGLKQAEIDDLVTTGIVSTTRDR